LKEKFSKQRERLDRRIFMKRLLYLAVPLFLLALVAGPVLPQEFIVYPAKGQSQEQMEKDRFECYSWAKGQTGFDPMEMPTATSAPPPQKATSSTAGGAFKGGVGGGLMGAGVGAIAGGSKGAKKGAAIGALSGGAIGGMRSSSQQKQDEQARKRWEQEQVAAYAQKRNAYNRAYTACLEGKGYTVK
jgi:outer membrane lipoprotein SlyB